jgi:hypothetical protein
VKGIQEIVMQVIAHTEPGTVAGEDSSFQPALLHQIRLRSTRGDIVVELEGREPPWLAPALDKLNELLQLPPNWNSYNSAQIEPRAVAMTIELLGTLIENATPIPYIVPTVQGGVQLEWDLHGMAIEVESYPDGHREMYVQDRRTGSEQELVLNGDLSPLVEAVRELTRRAA